MFEGRGQITWGEVYRDKKLRDIVYLSLDNLRRKESEKREKEEERRYHLKNSNS